jgi:hypothetical protein
MFLTLDSKQNDECIGVTLYFFVFENILVTGLQQKEKKNDQY